METLVRMQFGSHVYGTNVPTSDLDFKLHGYVYITTNLVNGKRYIGMKQLRSRAGRIDAWYLGSGKSLKQAIAKYGKGNFSKDVLYVSFDDEDLAQAEQAIIAIYDAVNDPGFYNLSHGGKGITLRGERHPRYGKPIPDGHRRALAKASRFSGYTHTEDAKRRISEKNSGKGNFFFGKRHTEETKAILSQKAQERRKCGHPWIGRKHEVASIARMIENQPHVVPLLYQGVEYVSINDIRKRLGFSHSKTRRMIRDGLIQIRKGELPYKEVADMLERGLDRLEECHRLSTLPDRGHHAAAEALVLESYRRHVIEPNMVRPESEAT